MAGSNARSTRPPKPVTRKELIDAVELLQDLVKRLWNEKCELQRDVRETVVVVKLPPK